MADITGMLQAAAGVGGEAVETDPNFNQTVLLLHGDGSNGAQNNTFLDSSSNGFSITRNGNTTQGTFSPFSAPDGRWSNFFDGSGDNLSGIGTTSDFNFIHNTSGLCTIECWVYWTGVAGTSDFILANRRNSAQIGFHFGYNASTGKWIFEIAKGSTGNLVVSAYSTADAVANQWVHLCVEWDYVSDSGTWYINGAVDSTFSRINTASTSNATDSLYIGRNATDTSFMWQGYISNLRISNSIVYGGAFTPSTEPLTTTSQSATNVELLTCQSNRFVDNSSNGYSETANGDVKVTPFSPYAPTAAYSAATNGGSSYYDGTGDYLVVPYNSAFSLTSGDFTVELWLYKTAHKLATNIGIGGSAWRINGNADGTLSWTANGSIRITSSVIPLYSWCHAAAVKSGSTTTFYINGVSVGTTTASPSATTADLIIGTNGGALTTWTFPGYMAGVRVLKGTAIDFSSTGIPTAPPTDITNTSILCNFTNAGIFDNTGKNNLETVGNAQIDTTVKKYGTGSMEFDGTGDVVKTSPSSNNVLGSGDFTLQFWVYPNNTSVAFRPIITSNNYSTVVGGWIVYQYGTDIEMYYFAGGGSTPKIIDATSSLTASTWKFVTIVRESGTLKCFVDGVEKTSGANTVDFTGEQILIGGNAANSLFFNGFLDDVRVTIGAARDGSVVPTEAFLDI